MALTKTQTAAICAVLVAIPLVMQWESQTQAQSAARETVAQVAALRQETTEINSDIARVRTSLARVQEERALAERRVADLRSRQSAIAAPAPEYAWDDAATLVRVPKEVLGRIGIRTMQDINGGLTDHIKEALQMTDDEAQRVEGAMRRAIAEFRAREGSTLKQVPPRPDELQGQAPEDVRVFEVPSLRKEYREWRETLLAEIGQVLGEDRLGYFKHGLNTWLILDDEFLGTYSTQVIFWDAKRVRIYRPGTLQKDLSWRVDIKFEQGGGSGMSMGFYKPPEPYRQYIADWLELEKQPRPPPARARQQP